MSRSGLVPLLLSIVKLILEFFQILFQDLHLLNSECLPRLLNIRLDYINLLHQWIICRHCPSI